MSSGTARLASPGSSTSSAALTTMARVKRRKRVGVASPSRLCVAPG
jgi:hypothetical protein